MILAIGLALSILAAVIPTVLYAMLVWWCDRFEREPWPLLTVTFLWGALPAVIFALLAELVLDIPLSVLGSSVAYELISSGGVAPIVEELVKAAALLGLFLLVRSEFDGVLDGIIYGALVGFGFAMTENFLYFMAALQEEGWSTWATVIFLRTVIFGFNHAFFTSLTGIGLGIARMARDRWLRWIAPLLGLGSAIFFHAIHNVGASLADVACLTLGISTLTDWGGVWVIVVIILLSWEQERRILREFLADEAIPTEVRQAVTYARLWQRVPVAAQVAGRAHPAIWREYHQLLAELALRKYRLARLGEEPELRQEIDQIRERLQALQRQMHSP
ncbi:MAG: PrsW family intramembrane metalloprotease [Anaerolineae bacterium]|nr:PrsW family intramembrane metalloprotease [Anaerolineae bacterium]MDW8100266.1 PrsW family intramembrane metalloprotease [Anaerolineae bacterium]